MNEIPSIDAGDRRLLDAVQGAFPLCERPFLALGDRVGISEDQAIVRLSEMKSAGMIRQISAIFDSSSLGYRSVLAAFQVDPDQIDRAADIISQHPGVSHNYERAHRYSIWFTLTVPHEMNISSHAQTLADTCGVKQWMLLPALRTFKIAVNFRMSDEPEIEASRDSDERCKLGNSESRPSFSTKETQAVLALQKDIPLVSRPFKQLAEEAEMTQDDLLRCASHFLGAGSMRRYAAILRHQKAGYRYNVMSVWSVPESQIEATGRSMASFPEVSHCYQRPANDDWPFSLYTMLHARSKEAAEDAVMRIRETTGIEDFVLLPTVREFKKTRVIYFTPEIAAWEKQHLRR